MPGRILIADDVATNRIVLKVKLSTAHYRVTQCSSAAETRRIARAQQTDLIVMAAGLPDCNSAVLCRQLKADPATARIPLLVLFDHKDAAARLEVLKAGADDVLCAPFDDTALLARVRNLLRARETDDELERRDLTACQMGFAEAATPMETQGRVGLIGMRAEQSLGWKSGLRGRLSHRVEVMDAAAAMALDDPARCPDLFCIATDLGEPGGGMRLMSELRSRQATRHAAILMVHPAGAAGDQITALDLGANGLLEQGFDPAELALRIDRQMMRKRRVDRLRASVETGLRMAATDPLTGLFNRRYADHHLGLLARQAVAAGTEFAVMMVDIDHFKGVNDTLGHAAGDRVLTAVAEALRDNLRGVDLVARYGGEEFLIALPESSPEAAARTADRLRRCVADLRPAIPGRPPARVTVSIGVAIAGSGPMDRTMHRADCALYLAKSSGRNRIEIAPPDAEPQHGRTADAARAPVAANSPQSRLRGPLCSDLSSRSV
ncbi:diguanylate cyclase [Oceaniglobus indicus]|uniref:diguanylate cyclase n=1 Tax=Oceaniglobus indicus TaxID=2047749 RepID=UPI001303F9C0|nr:diguanylate cyclase [Oceaniglobus indicus]